MSGASAVAAPARRFNLCCVALDARRYGMHPNVTKVVEAAADLGLEVETRTFPEGTRTAQDAAQAVGCDVGQIVKSLVFLLDGAPVIALVSGSNRLDEQRLA